MYGSVEESPFQDLEMGHFKDTQLSYIYGPDYASDQSVEFNKQLKYVMNRTAMYPHLKQQWRVKSCDGLLESHIRIVILSFYDFDSEKGFGSGEG